MFTIADDVMINRFVNVWISGNPHEINKALTDLKGFWNSPSIDQIIKIQTLMRIAFEMGQNNIPKGFEEFLRVLELNVL